MWRNISKKIECRILSMVKCRLNRWVLSLFSKAVCNSLWRRFAGRAFHGLGALTANLRSPNFFFDPGMSSLPELADLNSDLLSDFWRRSLRYSGQCSVLSGRWTRVASVCSIRQCAGSLCSYLSTGVMGVPRGVLQIKRAAAFCATCSLCSPYCGRPTSRELA